MVELVDPLTDPGWGACAAQGEAGLFTSPPWLRTLANSYGLIPRASVVRAEGGGVRAGLAWCSVRDPRGERVRALPFSDYSDVLGHPTLLAALTRPLLAAGTPVTMRVRRRLQPEDPPGFHEVGRAAWHGLDLSVGSDALWAGLRGSASRNVSRARRLGVRIRTESDIDAVRQFHGLHRRLRKAKYRMLAQPIGFFEQLHAEFAPYGGIRTLLAEWEGEVVAGLLLLEWNGTLYYKFNASTETSCRPNDLLTWEAIRQGSEAGLTTFDFGLSDLDQPGLIRYKRKFASTEDVLATLVGCPGSVDDDNGFGTLLDELTRLLTDPAVPDDVTARGGELLYRYFA